MTQKEKARQTCLEAWEACDESARSRLEARREFLKKAKAHDKADKAYTKAWKAWKAFDAKKEKP
jgi:hypothetical protein